MKKQVVNYETRELIMEIDLPYSDPEKWAKYLMAYDFGCEIDLIDLEDDTPEETQQTAGFWSNIKSFFGF